MHAGDSGMGLSPASPGWNMSCSSPQKRSNKLHPSLGMAAARNTSSLTGRREATTGITIPAIEWPTTIGGSSRFRSAVTTASAYAFAPAPESLNGKSMVTTLWPRERNKGFTLCQTQASWQEPWTNAKTLMLCSKPPLPSKTSTARSQGIRPLSCQCGMCLGYRDTPGRPDPQPADENYKPCFP